MFVDVGIAERSNVDIHSSWTFTLSSKAKIVDKLLTIVVTKGISRKTVVCAWSNISGDHA